MKAGYILKYFYRAKFTCCSEKCENIRIGHRGQNLFEGKVLFSEHFDLKNRLKNEIEDYNEI